MVEISIIDDTVWDGEEHFFLVVNGTCNRVAIVDNEPSPAVTVSPVSF